MSTLLPYAGAAFVLFLLGLRAVIVQPHLLRKILAVNVMGAAVFLLLITLAGRDPNAAPDPVPHAMVLTGIVVAVSASGFALALARRIHADSRSHTLEEAEASIQQAGELPAESLEADAEAREPGGAGAGDAVGTK